MDRVFKSRVSAFWKLLPWVMGCWTLIPWLNISWKRLFFIFWPNFCLFWLWFFNVEQANGAAPLWKIIIKNDKHLGKNEEKPCSINLHSTHYSHWFLVAKTRLQRPEPSLLQTWEVDYTDTLCVVRVLCVPEIYILLESEEKKLHSHSSDKDQYIVPLLVMDSGFRYPKLGFWVN